MASSGASNPSGTAESEPNDEAESQMRKALGLLGEGPRHRPDTDRMEQPSRLGDRFNGGLHRRRFVQDGDIPVTVLRRDQGHEVPTHRGVVAPPTPTSSRLQRTEAALAAETAAREKAERSLAETQTIVRDLQTKIGHAELAKNEATEALRQEREFILQIRTEFAASEDRISEVLEQVKNAERDMNGIQEQLADEQHARKAAEKALRVAETARDAAEQLVRTLSEDEPVMQKPLRRMRPIAEPDVGMTTTARGRSSEIVAEPEPVKWWLNVKPTGKKR